MKDSKETEKTKVEQIIGMIREFCNEKLNEEYGQLCVELAMTLDDLPGSPLCRGREEIWAAAIVYTVGRLNFLFDKSFEPYIRSSEIFDHFSTAGSTVSAKSGMIIDNLDLHILDNRFATRRQIDWNPLNSLVMVDDMLVPIEELPLEIQNLIKEAHSRGEHVSFSTEYN